MPAPSEDEKTRDALTWLRARGFTVQLAERFHEWTTVGELRKRFGHKPSAFHKRLHHRDCPDFPRELGPNGRIVRLMTTDALVFWLSLPVHARKSLAASCRKMTEALV